MADTLEEPATLSPDPQVLPSPVHDVTTPASALIRSRHDSYQSDIDETESPSNSGGVQTWRDYGYNSMLHVPPSPTDIIRTPVTVESETNTLFPIMESDETNMSQDSPLTSRKPSLKVVIPTREDAQEGPANNDVTTEGARKPSMRRRRPPLDDQTLPKRPSKKSLNIFQRQTYYETLYTMGGPRDKPLPTPPPLSMPAYPRRIRRDSYPMAVMRRIVGNMLCLS